MHQQFHLPVEESVNVFLHSKIVTAFDVFFSMLIRMCSGSQGSWWGSFLCTKYSYPRHPAMPRLPCTLLPRVAPGWVRRWVGVFVGLCGCLRGVGRPVVGDGDVSAVVVVFTGVCCKYEKIYQKHSNANAIYL